MATDRLAVHVRTHLAGSLAWDRATQRGTFTYDAGYRDGADPTPLSLSMPLAASRHSGAVVAAYFWGLLPDNDAVLERWARRFQVSLANPMGFLANVGRDLPGAVAVVVPDAELDGTSGAVDWLAEADVEELLRNVRENHTSWLGPSGRWSLAGAQAKIALHERDGRWGTPSGSTPTNRILKPAIDGLDGHDIIEHLCLATARSIGIRTVRTRLLTFGAERAIVVDRYDRRFADDGATIIRYHQEDLCQALGVHPAAKYESDGGPSALDVVRALRTHVDPARVDADVATFVDALVFNWLIAAPDAHAKNCSVLLDGGCVRFAPLYDIASILPYGDVHVPKVKLAMKVGGYHRLSAINANAWRRFATDAGLDPVRVIARGRELAEQVPDAMADLARPLRRKAEKAIAGRLTGLVAARAADCRTQLS